MPLPDPKTDARPLPNGASSATHVMAADINALSEAAADTAVSLADIRDQLETAATGGGVTIADSSTVLASGSSTTKPLADWMRDGPLNPSALSVTVPGGVARTLAARFSDVVNVLDFIPANLHEGIRARTNTTDLTGYVVVARATLPDGGTLYFPAGKYEVEPAAFQNPQAALRIIGDGQTSTVIQSHSGGTVIDLTKSPSGWNHRIEIGHLMVEGIAGSSGHGIYSGSDHSHLFIHDVYVHVAGKKGVYLPSQWHTLIQDVSVTGTGDNLFEIQGGNSTLLIRCYAMTTPAGFAGFRIYGGATLISCNGIDNQASDPAQRNADWGVFGAGNNPAWAASTAYGLNAHVTSGGHDYEATVAGTSGSSAPSTIAYSISDGTVTWRHLGPSTAIGDRYANVTMIGCNVEDFTRHGVRLINANAKLRVFGGTFLGSVAGGDPSIAIYREDVTTGGGVFVEALEPYTKGASWMDGYAIHAGGSAPPVQTTGATISSAESFYNRAGGYAASVPRIRSIASGFQNTALFTRRMAANALISTTVTVTYSASMTLSHASGSVFEIVPTDANNFTVSIPGSASPAAANGQRLSVRIKNTTAGALGSAFWSGVRISTWVQPAAGNSRSVEFLYNGSSWVEVSRTPADVPN